MVLTTETITRIAKDVKYILKNPLDNDNIYYKHDETNLLRGYALIIGNSETPYSHGYYFFEFQFPENYPYQPPIVKFLTNDGYMRFNPNLYINGKVCLSILNTWHGDSWSSCQNINSILLILATVLNKNPLLNEPGINENNANITKYNKLVSYKNIEYSIIKQFNLLTTLEKSIQNNQLNNQLNNQQNNQLFNIHEKTILTFNDVIKNNIKNNYDYINKMINELKEECKNFNNSLYISVYNLNCKLNFAQLQNYFDQIKNYI